jgi:hypothetical protein
MELPTVACVLMASPEFTPEYVERLFEGVKANWTGPLDFLCLTDTPINHPEIREFPLEYRFPGTWCKMELFRPDVPAGNILFFDLDTIICGSLDEIRANTRHTMLKRLKKRHRHQLASGMMYLPPAVRGVIWDTFKKAPKKWARHHKFGDSGGRPPGEQGFCQQTWERQGLGHGPVDPTFDYEHWNREGPARWQELFPGQVESYKLQVRKRGAIGPNTRVVVFHGAPRPTDIGWTLPPRKAGA